LKSILVALALVCVSGFSHAAKLETEGYTVTIDVLCKEGVIGCDAVRYTGVSRKTGKSIILMGKEVHRKCADGVTPCRFLGYFFKNRNVTYWVSEEGALVVTAGKKIVLDEQGTWAY
jgi:hypothetical protein